MNPSLSPSRVSLLVIVVAAIVLLASLLAYEAHDAARSERLTAERALGEYAFMAGAEFRDAFRDRWTGGARQALGAATSGLASSPFDPLPPLRAVHADAMAALPCAHGADSLRRIARVDLRTGGAEVIPSSLDGPSRQRLLADVRRAAQRLPAPGDPYLLAVRSEGDSGFLVIGVRFVRLGAPIGLFAFTVCPSAIERRLPDEIAGSRALLPSSIAGPAENGELLRMELRRTDSAVVWRLGESAEGPHRATTRLDETGLQLTTALSDAADDRVAVGGPNRSRVPLLISLLVLTVALGAVALVQLRREHDLARMRADFTSSVSHELRTPLTQILLYGETLQLGRARTAEDRRFAADTIVQEAGRLMHMVENMLSFARARRGAERPRLRLTDLARAVADTVATFQPLATAAHALLTTEGNGVWAVVDPGWFRQVLLNLLDNAVKYGPPGQTIRVIVSRHGDRARVTVADEGSGVSASDRERIWMPYVRLTHSARLERGGTGLGLTVVRELVDAMHGRVWVEEAAGGGAAFVVEWALAQSTAVVAEAPAAEEATR